MQRIKKLLSSEDKILQELWGAAPKDDAECVEKIRKLLENYCSGGPFSKKHHEEKVKTILDQKDKSPSLILEKLMSIHLTNDQGSLSKIIAFIKNQGIKRSIIELLRNLYTSFSYGEIYGLFVFFREQIDVNAKDNDGNTVIINFVKNRANWQDLNQLYISNDTEDFLNNLKIVRLLLDEGADIDSIRFILDDLVKLYLKYRENIRFLESEINHIIDTFQQIFRLIRNKGVNLLEIFIKNGNNFENFKIFFRSFWTSLNDITYPILKLAADKNNFDIVSFLLDTFLSSELKYLACNNNYDINQYKSDLIKSIKENWHMVDELTQYDENASDIKILMKQKLLWVALITAVTEKKWKEAKLLIEFANANITGDKDLMQQNLLWAAENNCVGMVKGLLENNLDINAANVNGETALIIAAKFGNYNVVDHLLTSYPYNLDLRGARKAAGTAKGSLSDKITDAITSAEVAQKKVFEDAQSNRLFSFFATRYNNIDEQMKELQNTRRS